MSTLNDVKATTWPQRMTSLFILACMALSLYIIAGLVATSSRTNTTHTSTEPVPTANTQPAQTPVLPTKLWFYSHNWRTVGGYVTVKNADGRILRGNFPTIDQVRTERWTRNNSTESQNVKVTVPTDYDFSRGYTIRFHAADGQVTRYQFTAMRADYDGVATFYLHVCEGWDSGRFQGEPLKLRIQGPVGYETAPDKN